jgi:hypothetical protein
VTAVARHFMKTNYGMEFDKIEVTEKIQEHHHHRND